MRKMILALVTTLAMIGLVACGSGNAIVKTNSGDITKDELYEAMKANHGDVYIMQLVEKMLLEKKYKVSSKEVDEELDKMKEQFETEEQFEEALQQNGFRSVDHLKEEILFTLLRKKAVTDGVDVSEEALEKYYAENINSFAEVDARHILVKEEEKAQEVLDKLKKGAKFEDLVEEYSQDPGSVGDGGKVGTVTMETPFVPEFLEATLKLKEGEISEAVQSEHGYHIIRADKRVEKDLKDIREEVEEVYLMEHARPYEEVREELFKEANIKVQDKQFKDLFKLEDDKE